MVHITEDVIRKHAEHNNCEISTLEELSLHQCDIERIEYLDKWCRELKILYLQSNLIPKIENLSKLKKLEYLNLALNNILDIENLEGCESLTKLDLTVNFISRATSVEKLCANEFLRDLYLTGNPCTDYVGYRDYVIAALPQLNHLDGTVINRSERIKALQSFTSLRYDILRQEKKYIEKLEKEKANEAEIEGNQGKPGFKQDWYTDTDGAHVKEGNTEDVDKSNEATDDFWNKPTKYTPETRLETHRYMEAKRKEKEEYKSSFPDPRPPKRNIRFFNDEGRPLNINQAKMEFSIKEDDEKGEYIVDVACYKHLDTSLIDADIQPTYVRVSVKGKVLQLVLLEEVSPDAATAQRSQATGHLVLTLPKMKYVLDGTWEKAKPNADLVNRNKGGQTKEEDKDENRNMVGNEEDCKKINIERLEIGVKKNVHIYNIVQDEMPPPKNLNVLFTGRKKMCPDKNQICLQAEEEFVDDLDVPSLE